MRYGGIGTIEDGSLKGRKFIIPSIVYVEKGTDQTGGVAYAKACLIHHRFVPDEGCDMCEKEVEQMERQARELGL